MSTPANTGFRVFDSEVIDFEQRWKAGARPSPPGQAGRRRLGTSTGQAGPGADTVVVVVSELVTNGLRNSGGTCPLDLTVHPGGIEMTVHDRSPHACRPRHWAASARPGE